MTSVFAMLDSNWEKILNESWDVVIPIHVVNYGCEIDKELESQKGFGEQVLVWYFAKRGRIEIAIVTWLYYESWIVRYNNQINSENAYVQESEMYVAYYKRNVFFTALIW